MPNTARFWFTMHWPHPQKTSEDFPWFFYLQHQYEGKGNQLSSGDKVVFYETGSGRRHRSKEGTEWVNLDRGRKGVICIAEVSGPIQNSNLEPNPRQYKDGAEINWTYEIPCSGHKEGRGGRKVEYGDVLTILNRGSILIRSGLIEINASQYREFCQHLGI